MSTDLAATATQAPTNVVEVPPSSNENVEMNKISNGVEVEGVTTQDKVVVDGGKDDMVEDDEKPVEGGMGLPPGMSRFNFVMLFVGLALAVFLAALDQTIVSIAIPS